MAYPLMAKLQRNWASKGVVRAAVACAIGLVIGTAGCSAGSNSGGRADVAASDGGAPPGDASSPAGGERVDGGTTFGGGGSGGAAPPSDAGNFGPDGGMAPSGGSRSFGGLPAVPPSSEDGVNPGGFIGGGVSDAGAGFDAGSSGGTLDGGATRDAGTSVTESDVQPSSQPLSQPVSEGSTGPRATCYNGVDDDDMGGTDCDDAQCHALRSCCIDHGDCCAPVTQDPPLPGSLDFGACSPGDPATCFPDAVDGTFGTPAPWIDDRGLAPGGDASFDSGLVVGRSIDLTTRRVVVQAEFDVPAACGTGCIDSAGVALTAQTALGDASHVMPIAGLLLAGAENTMHLVVGGRIMASWDVSEGSRRWSLRVRPNGELSVHRDGEEVTYPDARPAFAPASNARLVIYGRTRNSPERNAGGVRIDRVETAVELCDMPAAWRDRGAIELLAPNGASMSLSSGIIGPRAPSISKVEGEWLAFASQGAIYVARRKGPGVFQLVSSEPVLTHPSDGTLDDPELVWVGPDRWRMYVTWANPPREADSAEATQPVIAWVDASSPAELDAAAGVQFLSPGREIEALEAPTVAKHPDAEVLVAKADMGDGSQRLVAYRRPTAGGSWQRIRTGDLGVLTDPTSMESIVPDADAIGSPSLMIANGAWNLYFTRRRGTSRAIVMLVSDELVHWRPIDGGAPVLKGSGRGFDRIGVSDPDVRRTARGVALFYTGHDGVTTALGRTTRDATSSGSLRTSASAI